MYEIPTLLISLLAVVISAVSLIRARPLGEIQARLAQVSEELTRLQIASMNEQKLLKNRPEMGVRLSTIGRECNLVIMNTGLGSAFNVDVRFLDTDDNPLVNRAALLPYPELKSRSTVKVIAAQHMGSPQRYHVELTWADAAGAPASERFWISNS